MVFSMESKGGVLMQKYELGKLLGQGTFAKVHHGRNLKTGMSVAIKIIDKEKVLRAGLFDQVKREISVMKLIQHPNVVHLYEVMATRTKIYFVIEYVKGGELFNKLSKGKVTEDVARRYFQQLISAVDFCHSRGVYHRDLKPENLLLDDEGNLKISDFGLSALTESKRQDGLLHTTCGTPSYVAPEVLNQKGYEGAKADIWSCGVILYVLLAGYLPFHDSNLMEMYRKIAKAEFKFPSGFPSEARRLVSKILDPNPKSRFTISKIMENSWFKKGFEPKPEGTYMEGKETESFDTDKIFAPLETDGFAVEGKQEEGKIGNLNAFDIISLAAGFDLSGLFEEKEEKKEVRFTCRQPAKTIIRRMEELGKKLKMKVMKRDGAGLMKLEGLKEGRKGILSIDAEIFEVAPNIHMVEVRKSGGDTVEYRKVMKEEMRPGLKDIVWSWQGDRQEEEWVSSPPGCLTSLQYSS